MCLQPLSVPRYNDDGRLDHYDMVPCGKCLECVRDKQNGYMQRCYHEALNSSAVHFVTLTYRPSAAPLAKTVVCVDADGFLVDHAEKMEFLDPRRESQQRSDYLDLHTWYPQYDYSTFDETSRSMNAICASLRRKDVRLWLKRVRVEYEREFGRPLSPFKYLILGEYGPRTGNPHYHCLFFGLDDAEMGYVNQRWRELYGFVDYRNVPFDGTQFCKVALYVSKYICKGSFENDYVMNGFCEKPRVMVSKNFGNLCQKVIDVFQALDHMEDDCSFCGNLKETLDLPQWSEISDRLSKFGTECAEFEYDPKIKEYILRLVPESLMLTLSQRKYITIGDLYFKLSKWYKNRLYKQKIPYANNKSGFKTQDTPLFRAIKAFERCLYLEIYNIELQVLQRQYPDEDIVEVAFRKACIDEASRFDRSESLYSKLKRQYSSSVY